MRLAENQNQTVKVGQWVLHRFQWYLVESIDGDTLQLIGDDGETAETKVSNLDGIGEMSQNEN